MKGNNGNTNFIIDGGIPQYRHGIIHVQNEEDSKNIKEIYLNNLAIGTSTEFHESYGLVNFYKVKFLLNNKPIRGISLFLAIGQPFIKLIPFQNEFFEIKLNSIQSLRMLSN